MSDLTLTPLHPLFPRPARFVLRALALGGGLAIGWHFGLELTAKTGAALFHDGLFTLAAMLVLMVVLGVFMRLLGVMVPVADVWPVCLLETLTGAAAVTTRSGQVLAANRAYQILCARMGYDQPVALRVALAHEERAAQVLFRLVQAEQQGHTHKETLRLDVVTGRATKPQLWYFHLTPLPPHPVHGDAALWQWHEEDSVPAVIEPVYDSLREAAEALDQAPVGYLALDSKGHITQINATLAEWLHWDLALFVPGEQAIEPLLISGEAVFAKYLAGGALSVAQPFLSEPVTLRTADGRALAVRAAFATERSGHTDLRVILVADWFADQQWGISTPSLPASPSAVLVSDAVFFTHAPMAVAVLDADGCVLKANPRFESLFGSFAVIQGKRFDHFIADDRRSHMQEALTGFKTGAGQAVSFETKLSEGDRSVAIDLVPAYAEAAAMVAGGCSVLFARETTEQRNLQAQFEQAQKMQAVGELAGGIAHDFNNVLQGILGFTDLLLVSHRPTDPSFQDLMQIKQNATRAAGLVRQLLAFSRRQTLRPRLVSLNDAVTDVSHLVRRLLGEAVPLDIKLGRDLWPVMTDPGQFEQAVLNLAVNARDAMADGGQLSIRTRNITPDECFNLGDGSVPNGSYVAFEIEDTGLGIAAADLPKIFQPFFTTKDVGKGTGLGLSMVYGFVKQSGGFVFCESQVGQGTCFTLLLPKHEGGGIVPQSDPLHPKPSDMPSPAASVADMTGAETILLVEDEDAVRAFAARALTQRGYQVIEAASGVEALEQVRAHPAIDLIVSDVVMPEMDGPTMLKHLRAEGANKPIIFVSGYAEEAFARNLPEGEDFGFLPKPFTLKQLVEAVKQALNSPRSSA